MFSNNFRGIDIVQTEIKKQVQIILHNYTTCMVLSNTFIPVLVASLTAFNKLSYLGLKATVNAQSIILPK